MFKLVGLVLLLFFYHTYSYAYIDPVTTGVIYQILFFIITGFIAFFTKIKKSLAYIFKEYKYSVHILYILSLFPTWIFLSDLNQNEILIVLLIFLVTPLTIIYTIKMILPKNEKNYTLLMCSFMTVYSLDQIFGFASIVNMLRIMDDTYRYSFYLLLFIIFFTCCYFLYLKNKKIINLFILIIFFSTTYNLINNEKNIKRISEYEIRENQISKIQIDSNIGNHNPTIVLILDEMNGLGGLNDEIHNTKRTKVNSNYFFKKYDFIHYPNAYSIYASTADSVPSLLNFHYEYNYEKMKNFRKPDNKNFAIYEKIMSNKLFDLFDANKVYVHQTLGLDFCAYENFKICKTINPFSKNYEYIDNFELNNLDYIFSKYSFQTSIFASLLTRFLRHFNLIKIIEPRLIGKVTIEHVLKDLFVQSKKKEYDLILGHLLAPHKPFAWEENNCKYKYYKNPNFLSEERLQEYHNIEIECINKYLGSFLDKLKQHDLLNYYNIIITSDHGARNLNFANHEQDWHSVLYAERKIGDVYEKNLSIKPTQLLFNNFFNNKKINNIKNKVYDHKISKYKSKN